jgi:hypothetical protein
MAPIKSKIQKVKYDMKSMLKLESTLTSTMRSCNGRERGTKGMDPRPGKQMMQVCHGPP